MSIKSSIFAIRFFAMKEKYKTEIQNSLKALRETGTILYPTDTVWGIGCDARNEKAVEKIYKIKQRASNKALLCIVSDRKMLESYVEIGPEVERILAESTVPTTIIYPKAKALAKNLIAADGSIAIRIVQSEFCKELIREFGAPIVSTSANISKHKTPNSFKEIEASILEGVDYIVNLQTEKKSQAPSRLIQINPEGEIIILRD